MSETPVLQESRRSSTFGSVLFWGWNVVFLAFFLLGFAPLQLPLLIKSVRDGTTPVIYLVFSLVLIALPIAATLIGIFFLRKRPERLFAMGYVVEWPLLLILLFRFFVIREGNPAITVLLAWLAVAEAVFLWFLLDEKGDERSSFWQHVRLAGLTLLFSGTIYAAIWLAFYVPLVAVLIWQMVSSTIKNFGDILLRASWSHWYEIPVSIIGFVLLLFSSTLIVVMPVAAPILAGKAWLRSLRRTLRIGSLPGTILTAALPLAAVLALLWAGMQQPQQTAFRLLKEPPTSLEQAKNLVKREETIRAGLLNAYLASFRYISSVGEVRHISGLYHDMLNMSQESAWSFEQSYEVVIRPFLYAPVNPVSSATSTDNRSMQNDQAEAAVLYQRFFDQPIAQGERSKIVDAVRANSNGAQAELAWQVVDDREVHLKQQDVNLTEHGDWAEVQIHEVYENVTFQRQEVVYYFSLPESAVVTGLWLGSSPDRSKAYAFQVAPRGAAQAVYRNEVRYMRDPALIEQIGPRQYRLRAFPVEPRRWMGNSEETQPGPELHLWMSYRSMAVDGAWPMPQLAQKFNVFWDAHSIRMINGKRSSAGEADWFPASLRPSQAVTLTARRVDFPEGISVVARPAAEVQSASLPENLRLAVVLDRSFSMRERAGEVKQALSEIKQVTQSGPDPDIYLTASIYRGEGPGRVGLASLDPDQVFYFGGQNSAELLAQYEELSAGKQYDAVLVLTDGTGYELGQGDIQVQVPNAPVWLVHLGGGFPLGYDDSTLQAIQASGGGAAASVDEALARYAISLQAPGMLDVVDGYLWQTLPTSEVGALTGSVPVRLDAGGQDAGFAALAARRVILAEMTKNRGKLDDLPILDQINQLAVDQGIVTPYSSMLVLVNPTQQDLLEKLSAQDDRFQREVENVGLTASTSPFAVTGVPEPEEWLLLILAVIALGYVVRRNLAQKSPAVFRRGSA